MKAVDRILGEAKRLPLNYELTDPYYAYKYAKDVIKGRWPDGEATIAKDPNFSYLYSVGVVKGRFLGAEPNIAKDPALALEYARDIIKGRWPEAETAIANSSYRDKYLDLFPEAKDDWVMNGWLDWLDT